ncbi:hypothetical protein PIB30_076556 [Stylosanthes scabra]|uniref:PH domain-containing protein n=1 Tax=Stylosanthes scabra TaxID=79078 RepID=A0ABU6WRI3_9FABA|nr:hypothetical protein [Stylosanthes scabra]
MIVHIQDNELIYLDSLKCKEVHDAWVKQMTDMDRKFYLNEVVVPPAIDTFGLEEPPISQQCSMSKDCGIWVA